MAIIPEETVQAVRDNTDIVELINKYVPVKRAGSQYKANCPFHNERTPSFNINVQRQYYHCFGCGASGDAISFVMEYENLPFTEAVRKLAADAGIPIIEEEFDPAENKKKKYRSRLIQLHNESCDFMHNLLMQSPEAKHGREYLKSRGYGADMAKRWKIGWMPENLNDFTQWAKSNKYKAKELIDGSLAGFKDTENPGKGIYIKFRNRLMFPIMNDYGDVIAYSGRQLIHDPKSGKYVNSNETTLFKKSSVFFGLDKAKKAIGKENFALLCEGQMDVIACHEAGVNNCLAGLGTAITTSHAKILKRYTKNAVLCFDSDTAGNKATERAFIEFSKQGMSVKVVTLPEGEDPDSLIQKNGTEAFKEYISKATDFLDFKFTTAQQKINFNDVQQKSQFAHELTSLIAIIPDKVTRDAYIQQISSRLAIGSTEIRSQVSKTEKKAANQHKYSKKEVLEEEHEAQQTQNFEIDRAIANLCIYVLYDQKSMQFLSEQLESLYDAILNSIGGQLLLSILAKRPKIDTPNSLHAFMLNLKEHERAAISELLKDPLPEDIYTSTQETLSLLVNKHLLNQDSILRAQLNRTDLSDEEAKKLIQNIQEIADLLENSEGRFMNF